MTTQESPKSSLGPATMLTTMFSAPWFAVNWFTQHEGLHSHGGKDMKLAMYSLTTYFLVWYFIMARQGSSKAVVNEEFLKTEHAKKPDAVAWFTSLDRSFLNMQEQCPMFLSSFMVYAIFVSPIKAAYVGWAYSFLTALYPALHPKVPLLFITTFPRYFLIFFMITGCVVAAIRT
uniref:Uncharacterized protein n=1 Tax=Zooxanthella nutricula TaxID=1333877 RepID=A0A6U8XUR0_9DINO|mmetsp:Transcript_26879/g.81075  ORF Transcript_26879/g.81075 Transcript_26879/m.81075 type:complete len:175 (+) Transcript_26879:95-619(+)|eukprot:CAMPEP_0198541032 /NCGR_PEP_ID=MMETSP1462-20131121/53529_1 /TAXON_ID=1333877 /ORGANISM="Brandtodinium nutriculum, Strain RCC3387" /LENGTH=174 /DNA_ID=CAMNT_0044271177 /DNA_START=98 /DNA_END=622 /DNA_ORIENTATION=+